MKMSHETKAIMSQKKYESWQRRIRLERISKKVTFPIRLLRKVLTMAFMGCLMMTFLGTGCAPALIGAIAYKSVHNKKERQAFLTEFQKTNMERESKHLKALDYCTEYRRFDSKAAAKDKECKY